MPNFTPSFYLLPSWAVFFHFLDEFMSFVCFLSSVDCNYFICSDFNIHVDVPCTVSCKLESLLESCNLTQSVNNTTHLHGHTLDLILSPNDQAVFVCMLTSVNLYLIIQLLNVLLAFLPLLLTVKQEFPIGDTIISICPTFGLTSKNCLL